MERIQFIYDAIAVDGFKPSTLQAIDEYINEIENGRTDFYRFNLPEHAGLCTAGAPLIGGSIVACYATRSFATSGDAAGSQGGPANWEIDQLQEQLIEQWAKATHLWVEKSEEYISRHFDPMIAQGAESKVYYKEGDISVVKERVSIYSTTQTL